MAAIARKNLKIFGGNLSATNNIAKFGSLKAGAAAYSIDPELIQSIAGGGNGWLEGWAGAVVTVGGNPNVPPLQDVNAVEYVFSYMLAYLLERGIPEWDDATEYNDGDFCRVGKVIYLSLANANTNNDPASDHTNWTSLEAPAGASTAGQSVPVDTAGHLLTMTEDFDPDAVFATSKYTAKVAGIYRVSAYVQVDNDTGVVGSMELALRIVKNGATIVLASGENTPNPSGARWYPKVMGTVQLAANDTLEVQLAANDGTNTGAVDASNGNLSVERVRAV